MRNSLFSLDNRSGNRARRRRWRRDRTGTARSSRTPVYVFVEISDVNDPEGFKAVPAKSGPETLAPFGGRCVIRTEKITPLDGTAPKRFVVIAFDSMEKAMAWKASASSKEVDVIRDGTTKSTQFLVEGLTPQ